MAMQEPGAGSHRHQLCRHLGFYILSCQDCERNKCTLCVSYTVYSTFLEYPVQASVQWHGEKKMLQHGFSLLLPRVTTLIPECIKSFLAPIYTFIENGRDHIPQLLALCLAASQKKPRDLKVTGQLPALLSSWVLLECTQDSVPLT